MTSLHFLGQDDRHNVQHDFIVIHSLALGLASHDAVSILNVTVTFLMSKQSKLDVTQLV